MNRDSLHLTHWYPGWLRDDDVDPENQSSLMADLRAFIRDPFGKETFASTIPFRIIGHVTDHPQVPERGHCDFVRQGDSARCVQWSYARLRCCHAEKCLSHRTRRLYELVSNIASSPSLRGIFYTFLQYQ